MLSLFLLNIRILLEKKAGERMLLKTSIRQGRRAAVRIILCFLLMALVCAFLTIGLNLRASTEQNLAAIYESYEVIAVPDFQAYVTRSGKLATAGNHAGYWPCEAVDYDLTPILQATGVESIDVRNRFGAYVGNEGFERGFTYAVAPLHYSDVIRFVYEGAQSVQLSSEQSDPLPQFPIRVVWSAAGIPVENYPINVELEFDRHVDVDILLEPGETYIASLDSNYYSFGATVEKVHIKNFRLDVSAYYQDTRPMYDGGSHWETWPGTTFEPIANYTEDFWSTELGAYYVNAAKASYYNLRSVNAVTTSDLTSVLPFYKGTLSVTEGRLFSAEEYDSGAKVCIISSHLAQLNGWKLGDRIDLSFYNTTYLYDSSNAGYIPRYNQPVEGFFDEGGYEIIGLYDGLVTTDLLGSDVRYTEQIGALYIDVYLPESSVQNAPVPKLSENNVSIRLEVLSGQAFLAEMNGSGLMEKKREGYQLGLTVYDQGLSAVANGLAQLSDIGMLTVALSAAAAVLVVIVVIVFHVWRSKKEIACLRSLGVRKGQVLVMILAGLLLVSAFGCAVGALCGHLTSQWVAERIVADSGEDLGDLSFTAGSSADELWSELEEFRFEGTRVWYAAVFSGCIVMAAMLLFGILLAWLESRKPPLQQLGRKE